LDGVQKMSKSLNNYIGITDAPDDMFGKIMSISDELMWRYFELLSFRPMDEIAGFKQEIADGRNPRDIKFLLGEEIVARFHDEAAGVAAREAFVARFQKGALPDEMPEHEMTLTEPVAVAHLLRDIELVSGTSEAYRMIKQGAVKIDGEKVEDRDASITETGTYVCQVGKRKFARVTFLK